MKKIYALDYVKFYNASTNMNLECRESLHPLEYLFCIYKHKQTRVFLCSSNIFFRTVKQWMVVFGTAVGTDFGWTTTIALRGTEKKWYLIFDALFSG